MKKLLFIILLIITSMNVMAGESVTINGIRYNLYYSDGELHADVISLSNSYKEDIVIPQTIRHNNKNYIVDSFDSYCFENSTIENLYIYPCISKCKNQPNITYLNYPINIYIHAKDYSLFKKSCPFATIKTIDCTYIDYQVKEDYLCATFKIDYIHDAKTTIKIDSVCVNGEIKKDIDKNDYFCFIENLQPASTYKVYINWSKWDGNEKKESGTDIDSITTKKPEIVIAKNSESAGYDSIKFKLSAFTNESLTPTEIGCRIYDCSAHNFLPQEYKQNGDEYITIKDLYPGTIYEIHGYAIYNNKRCDHFNPFQWIMTLSCGVGYQYEATQNSISITDIFLKKNIKEIHSRTIGMTEKGVDISEHPYTFTGQPITFNNLKTNTKYKFSIDVYYDNEHWEGANVYITTKDIEPKINATLGATSINLTGTCDSGDAKLKRCYFKGYEDQGSNIVLTGLKPNSTHEFTFVAETTDGYTKEISKSISTEELSFESLTPKVVNNGSAIICAKTNIANDEPNVGFEWRKVDAPEIISSKQGYGIVYDGVLEGRINNLSTDSYYKARPFYKDGDGTFYYGEWIGFDSSDISYFEPTVHTYASYNSANMSATLRGCVLQGTDDIVEQGFEYWTENTRKEMALHTTSDIKTITATGQNMSATITDLAEATTYSFRAYAKTTKGTTYGETQQFTTPVIDGINDVLTNRNNTLQFDVRTSNNIEISINGANTDCCNYIITTIGGNIVARGCVPTDGEWHTLSNGHIESGFYIITVTDNKNSVSKKIIIR